MLRFTNLPFSLRPTRPANHRMKKVFKVKDKNRLKALFGVGGESKALKFTPELSAKILSGEKTSTWRLFDDKNLQKATI